MAEQRDSIQVSGDRCLRCLGGKQVMDMGRWYACPTCRGEGRVEKGSASGDTPS